jgi:hypothetical protein
VRDAGIRVAVVLVVIGLHGLALLLFLLPARLPGFAAKQPGRETVLYLLRAPPPPVRPISRPRATVPLAATRPGWRNLPAAPAPPSESELQGLGADLFSCRPEDVDGLSPDQRERCARTGLAVAQPPPGRFASLQSRTRQPGRWAAELARKKAPPLAPCFSHAGFSPLATAFCVAEMAIDGYDQDNHEKYYLGN